MFIILLVSKQCFGFLLFLGSFMYFLKFVQSLLLGPRLLILWKALVGHLSFFPRANRCLGISCTEVLGFMASREPVKVGVPEDWMPRSHSTKSSPITCKLTWSSLHQASTTVNTLNPLKTESEMSTLNSFIYLNSSSWERTNLSIFT